MSQIKLGLRLAERGFQSDRYSSGPNRGRRYWMGIGLLANTPEEPESRPEPVLEGVSEPQDVQGVNSVNSVNRFLENSYKGTTKEFPESASHPSHYSHSGTKCVECGEDSRLFRKIPRVLGGGYWCEACTPERFKLRGQNGHEGAGHDER